MKTEFMQQYQHTWRMCAGIVRDFERDAWVHTGRGTTFPVRLAFHIVQSVKYYLGDTTPILLASGEPFAGDWNTTGVEDWPSQDDIVACLDELRMKTDQWLSAIDPDADNNAFPWAGKTQLGVMLFLLRHTLYHIGELNALLDESKRGTAEDNWVKTL